MSTTPVYTRCVMEMALAEFRPAKAFPGGKRATRHLLKVDLVWPRPGIARRTAAWPVEGTAAGMDLGREPLRERLLFKEIIEGPFGIEAHCTAAVGMAEMLRLLGAVAGALSDLTVRTVGGLTAVPFQYAGRLLGTADRTETRLYGSAACFQDVSAYGLNKDWQMLPLPLVAPQTLYEASGGGTRRGATARRRAVLAAGTEIGTLTLALRFIRR